MFFKFWINLSANQTRYKKIMCHGHMLWVMPGVKKLLEHFIKRVAKGRPERIYD